MNSHGDALSARLACQARLSRAVAQAGGACQRWLISAFAAVWIGLCSIAPQAGAEEGSHAGIVSRMRRHPVESRALNAVGYSKRLKALEVEFKRGGTYRYLDVPWSVYRDLLAAESKARFYNQQVRGKYKSVYVRPRRKR